MKLPHCYEKTNRAQNPQVTYLLGDHLGSTSIVTDDAGTLLVETRYCEASRRDKPWGEVRYSTPDATLPTRYSYTGQYSHMPDEATDLGNVGFGLMFYNARWYDPSLSRFAQADSIVPDGVQGLDRYAYVRNGPVRYNDPTGHVEACGDDAGNLCQHVDTLLKNYGVKTEGFTSTKKIEALRGAIYFGWYFYQTYSSQYGFTSPLDAFKKVTGGNISITFDPSRKTGCETTGSSIVCASDALYTKAFIHEFVHVMDNNYRSKTDAMCGNEKCLASSYFPQEYFSDSKYASKPYLCNNTDCISHPDDPDYGEYNTAEAYANYMENVILSAMNVDPANNGFKSNEYSDNLHSWSETGYGNIYTILNTITQ